MKSGFSTTVCPEWDLATIVRQAKEFGYQGVEVCEIQGRPLTPAEPAIASDPAGVRKLFADAGIELICLGTPVRLRGRGREGGQATVSEVRRSLDLAASLGCPFVRVSGGGVDPNEDHNAGLSEIADVLRQLAPAAADASVRILLANDPPFPGSRDMWFVMDAVDHPAVRCCWNPCHAMTIRERPTLSVPRLGTRIGMVHICDGRFAEDGRLQGYELPGDGKAEPARFVALLRGIAYDGYAVFNWPKAQIASLAGPEVSLPAAAKFLKEQIEAKGEVLTAYKGDKTAPRFAERPPAGSR